VAKKSKKSRKYLVEQAQRFRFKALLSDKSFLNEHRKLLKDIKHLNEEDKAFRTFYFSLRWRINWEVAPNKSFEENKKLLKEEMFYPFPLILELRFPILDCNLEGKFQINLKYPKRAIVRSFEEQLGEYIDRYKKKVEGAKTTKANLEKFKRSLTVYRYYEKVKSLDKVVKKYYNNESGDKYYAKQKAKRDCERGKQLVADRYFAN